MGDQRPEFSYYQIGGFRPNVFLKGCFTTFSPKIEATIQDLVMSDQQALNMTCGNWLKPFLVLGPQ